MFTTDNSQNSHLYIPSFPRKKRVETTARPNSYRVIFEEANYWPSRDSLSLLPYPDHLCPDRPFPPTNHVPRPKRDFRHNNPQPLQARFLRNNAATLNAPVCYVETYDTKNEQNDWWGSMLQKTEHSKAAHTLDSTSRADFRPWDYSHRNTRTSGNPVKVAANGAVPVNTLWEKDGRVRVWKEGMSYEHIYDSRAPQFFPNKGKRQGAFVWHQLPSDKAQAVLSANQLPQNRPEAEERSTGPISFGPECSGLPAYDDKSTRLPREPLRQPYHRQFVRRAPKEGEDKTAELVQPEFVQPWHKPQPEPFFSN